MEDDGRYLIDGIGLQAHLFTADDFVGYLAAVDTLAETGLKLQVTELELQVKEYAGYLCKNRSQLIPKGSVFCIP